MRNTGKKLEVAFERVLFASRWILAPFYLGMVFGVIGGTYMAALHGLDPTRVYSAMLLLLLPALVGARLLFIASHWEVYRREPSRIWRRSEGGAALYGGLLASFLFSLPLLAALGISVAAFWDAAAVASDPRVLSAYLGED